MDSVGLRPFLIGVAGEIASSSGEPIDGRERLAELAGEEQHLALVKLDPTTSILGDCPLGEREAFT